MSTTPPPGKRFALCCQCGTLRTYPADYYGRIRWYGVPDARPPRARWREQLARLQAEGIYTKTQPGDRCTIELRCATCDEPTGHAYLRDDANRDWAEKFDHTA